MVKAGYKQTEVGLIPEDWEATTFGEVVLECFSGATPYRGKPEFYKGEIPWISSGELDYNRIIDTEEKITSEAVKKTNLRFVPENTFLMAITGLEAAGTRGSCAITGIKATTNQSCMAIIPTAKLSTHYLFHYYVFKGEELAFKYCQGTKQQSYTASLVKLLPISLPSRKEQEVIATALSDVDALIAGLDKLIAKKRAIKTATMQQLLTGRKRLAGWGNDRNGRGYKQTEIGQIPQDWTVVNLSDIGQNFIGLTYKPESIREHGTLVLRSSNIQSDRLAFTDNVYVEMELPQRVIVQKDDILVCVRNGSRQLIGKCALIDEATAGNAFGAFMSVFRTDHSKFVFYQFQSNIIQNQIREIMGATINQITNKDMASFKIPLPTNPSEEEAITSIIADMDAEIAAFETRRAKTQAIKQGMMQELLTGRTRLL